MTFDYIPTLAPAALPPCFDPLDASSADLALWHGLGRPSQETLIEWASHQHPNEFKYIDPREED